VPELSDLKQRIEALETRNAYLEQSIEELSATLTDHWRMFEGLKKEIARLTAEIGVLEGALGEGTQKDPPPPHY